MGFSNLQIAEKGGKFSLCCFCPRHFQYRQSSGFRWWPSIFLFVYHWDIVAASDATVGGDGERDGGHMRVRAPQWLLYLSCSGFWLHANKSLSCPEISREVAVCGLSLAPELFLPSGVPGHSPFPSHVQSLRINYSPTTGHLVYSPCCNSALILLADLRVMLHFSLKSCAILNGSRGAWKPS